VLRLCVALDVKYTCKQKEREGNESHPCLGAVCITEPLSEVHKVRERTIFPVYDPSTDSWEM